MGDVGGGRGRPARSGFSLTNASRDLTGKVLQPENDVQAIYEMLAGISATQLRQNNRFEEISGTQAHLAATQAEHGAKLDTIIELASAAPRPVLISPGPSGRTQLLPGPDNWSGRPPRRYLRYDLFAGSDR